MPDVLLRRLIVAARRARSAWSYAPDRLDRLIQQGGFAGREVLASRADGFGMRMGEILNAWRIAEGFGAHLVFMWPLTENDGIRPAEEVFAPLFLTEHLIDHFDGSDHHIATTWRPDDVRALHRGPGRGVWSVSKRSSSQKHKFVLGTEGIELPPMPRMREAFDSIPFVKRLQDVKTAIDEVGPFATAIHVRRGDIVAATPAGLTAVALEGRHAHKAIPLPIVDMLVERAISETGDGRRVLLIGNGVRPLGLDAHHPSVFLADDVPLPDEEADVLDFRDFCLLTRARAVIAEGSAFAIVPTLIGDAQRLRVEDVLTPAERLDAILGFFELRAEHAPAEVAIACAHVLRMKGEEAADVRLRVLDGGMMADPSNPLLPLAAVVLLLRRGSPDQAASLLATRMPGPAAATLARMAGPDGSSGPSSLATLGGLLVRPDDWEVLARAADVSPWIQLVLSARACVQHDWNARSNVTSEAQRRSLHTAADKLSDPAVGHLVRLVTGPPTTPT